MAVSALLQKALAALLQLFVQLFQFIPVFPVDIKLRQLRDLSQHIVYGLIVNRHLLVSGS